MNKAKLTPTLFWRVAMLLLAVMLTATTAWADGDLSLEQDADGNYVIKSVNDLNELADYVNNGKKTCYGMKFILGANIAFDPNEEDNFTPIGVNGEFCGKFDGKGHSISGIRINNKSHYGLFGRIGNGATIQNVAIYDIVVKCTTGGYAGGLVGYNNGGTITDNLVIGATISGSGYWGAIVGHNSGELSNNYYYDCKVNEEKNKVGCGATIGTNDIPANDGAVSASDKLEITTIVSVKDLMMFAASVNAGNTYEGKTVTLMNDIDFAPTSNTGNNFISIGKIEYYHSFSGVFDGKGHSISGIRINRTDGDAFCGLFGLIYGATIKNVIISDIVATGSCAGGLVGYNEGGTIKDNLVIGATISGDNKCGAIVGSNYGNLSNNYYYNVNDDGTNIGCGGGDIPDKDGAVHVDYFIDGESTTALTIENENENTYYKVVYRRNLAANIYTTIMLPFQFKASDFGEGVKFSTFGGVDENDWTAIMNDADNQDELSANTPYIFKPTKNAFMVAFNKVTFTTTGDKQTAVKDWTFHGTYDRIVWNKDKNQDKETTNVYGFAATSKENTEGKQIIAAGEFVRAGYNVGIKPTRAYLEYTGKNPNLSKSALELPDRIKVVFIDKETASVIDDPTVNPSENENGDVTTPTSEIAPAANVKVWSYDKTIYIESRPGTDYRIIDVNGRPLRTSTTQSDRDEIRLGRSNGIAIVIIGGKSFKVNY